MTTETTPPKSDKRRSRFKRIRRYALLSLALLVVLAYFAPVIVARTFLLNYFARKALSDLNGSVSVGGATLGWFSPIELRDVRITDASGQTVLSAPKVTGTKALWRLARDSSDLGKLRVERPQANVQFVGDDSNVEQVFARYLEPSSAAAAGKSVAVEVEVTDASVDVFDKSSGGKWKLTGVNVLANVPKQGDAGTQVKIAGLTAHGKMDVKLSLDDNAGQLSLHVVDFPLELAHTLLRKFEPGLKVAGSLTADLQAQWSTTPDGGRNGFVNGKLSTKNLALRSAWLSKDQLELKRLELPCSVRLDNNVLHVENASLDCDVGTARLLGRIDLNRSLTANLAQPGCLAELDVDVARLAQMLPNTIRLQEDLALTKGRVRANVRSEQTENGLRWRGSVATSDLAAMRHGKVIEWREPLTIDFAALRKPGALPLIERLECRSTFLSVDARGGAEELTLTARYDLDRLTTELQRFIDVGSLKPAGSGVTRITLRQTSSDTVAIDGTTTLTNAQLKLGTSDLRESELVLALNGEATVDADNTVRINRASVKANLGEDHLELALTEPINDVAHAPLGTSVSVKFGGDLRRWHDRLRTLVSAANRFHLHGKGDVTCDLALDGDRLIVGNLSVNAKPFDFQGYGLHVTEPSVALRSDGDVDLSSGAITFRNARLTTPSTTLTTERLHVLTNEREPLQMTGVAEVNGPVENVKRWLALREPELNGTLIGNVRFTPVNKTTRMSVDASIRDLLYGPAGAPSWREPVVTVKGDVVYDEKHDLLDVEKVVATSQLVNCSLAGRLADLTGRLDLDVAGYLAYNLHNLEPHLRPMLGNDLKLDGKGTRPFHVSGSLDASDFLATCKAELGMHWTGLQAFGCQCGPAALQAKLSDGVLRFDPVRFTLNQGKVDVAPTLQLSADATELRIAKGNVIDKARLTPAMERALKYALPVTSGLTQASGAVSLRLDACRMPLSDLNRSLVAGEITIHDAEIAGSPLIRELTALLGAAAPTVRIAKESKVQFQLDNGWVHHRGLDLEIGGTTVRTNGAVRLDGALSMEAEMPVPSSWMRGRTLSSALANRMIRVPIGGTLSKPRINRRALQEEFERFVKEAAADALRDKAREGLNRLFPIRKP